MDFNRITTAQLILILGLFILFIPPILSSSAFLDLLDFSEKGQIGDTIGGLTSPFINAIAAILVFIAFKEQVKANELIKEQQYFQHIQEQIYRLEDNFLDIPKVIYDIETDIQDSSNSLNNFDDDHKQVSYSIYSEHLNKAIYIIALFQQAIDLISKMKSNKEFMQKRLKTLFKIVYQDNFLRLQSMLTPLTNMHSPEESYVTDLLLQIKDIQEKFGGNN